MADYTPPLLKVLDPEQDSDGVWWLPVAAWAAPSGAPISGAGCPWQLKTTLNFGMPDRRNEWDHLAFTAHFVTGLRDRYEHTFDAWERTDFYEGMLATGYMVEEVARHLGCAAEAADQLLLYRTLYTRVPAPLVEWRGCPDEASLRDHPSNTETPPIDYASEYAGAFVPPAPVESVYSVGAALSLEILVGAPPSLNEAAGRLLTFALTGGLLPWDALYRPRPQDPGRLDFRPEGLRLLREEMEREDPTDRIGCFDGGRNSDSALRWLLRARLVNIVGPRGLWAALVLAEPDGSHDWMLHPYSPPGDESTDSKVGGQE